MLSLRHVVMAGACILPLAGCRSAYDVDVRNKADQPVVASIVTVNPEGGGWLLGTARMGPGDRAALFAEVDPRQRVWIEADFAGNTGEPAKMDLVRGRNVIVVRRADQGARGTLKLEQGPEP